MAAARAVLADLAERINQKNLALAACAAAVHARRIKRVMRTELAGRMTAVVIRTVKALKQMLFPKMRQRSREAVRPFRA